MADRVDYQILLQEVVRTAREAAGRAAGKADGESRAILFAYYDILDVLKTQAQTMEVPLSDIGLEGVDLDALLKVQTRQAA